MDADPTSPRDPAEQIRRAIVSELERAYEEAAMQGLCGEGALEYALDRVRRLDLTNLLED